MKDRRLHLKIKIKTLAAEAEIIRFEAKKVKEWDKWCLNDHRTDIVRKAARRNLLAYAMMRGKPYSKVEPKTNTPLEKYHFEQIVGIARRFGCSDLEQIEQWIVEACVHLESQGYTDVRPKLTELLKLKAA